MIPGAESLNISDEDYENIEKMAEFGVQVFLNCLDKIIDATERMVKEKQLRSNRIAVQGIWNSFKETVNRISVEERGKGEQDDLVLAARTVRRLFILYQGNIQGEFHSVTTGKKSVQQYFPAVKMLEGVIQREKLNEVWGVVESYYFPGAPSVRNETLEFLCYLLSTDIVENVNILKIGAYINTLQERLQSTVDEIRGKANEFATLESKTEKEELLVSVRVAARVFRFYWDKFLEHTESPEFVRTFEKSFREKNEELKGILQAVWQTYLFIDILRLLEAYFSEVPTVVNMDFSNSPELNRGMKTIRALGNAYLAVSVPIREKIYEMDMALMLKRLFLRSLDTVYSLIGEEEFESLRSFFYKHWRSFKEEAHQVLKVERRNTTTFLSPQLWAGIRLLSVYTKKLSSKNFDDIGAEHLGKNSDKIRKTYAEKCLTITTQKALEEVQRVTRGQAIAQVYLFHAASTSFFWGIPKFSQASLEI
ncbi:uncharacterized protein [Hoplias malabaricus]|uniref:uncharacterized protein isoform X3 n=1 Tax=Hoplias malabaricus TaxID=27720 RepID=UPI003462616A